MKNDTDVEQSIFDTLPRLASEIDGLASLVEEQMWPESSDGTASAAHLDLLPQTIVQKLAEAGVEHKEGGANGSNAKGTQPDNLKQMSELFLSAAEMLLDPPRDAEHANPFWNWCKTRWETCDDSVTSSEAEKVRIELLTSCWLGLYFLGIPFGKPWERVLRWADDEGGGLPNGVCVAKAIGDIARDARKSVEKARSFDSAFRSAQRANSAASPKNANGDVSAVASPDAASTMSDCDPAVKSASVPLHPASAERHEPMLIVLSGLPILLFRELIRGPKREGCTPNSAHILGRCYELLQLVLYLRTGEKFLYCVRKESVVETFRFLEGGQREVLNREGCFEIWKRALQMLLDVRPVPFNEKLQKVLLVDDPMIPPCFINHEKGLYTFEKLEVSSASIVSRRRQREMPLPASYMRNIRRQLYVENLEDEGEHVSPNLLVDDKDFHVGEFDDVWTEYQRQKGTAAP